MNDSNGRCDDTQTAIRVDRGPRTLTTMEMTDSQLAELDPGATTPRRAPTEETAAILRTYRHDQQQAERQMRAAWGGEEERW